MSVSTENLLVTAVISTYNRCDDCKRAVVSALEQKPPPLEVLVCDDGSTDDTQAEFLRWQARDSRVRYVRVEPNRGTPAPSRNLGVSAARGEWVAFLDDDDRWLPGKLSLQVSTLQAGDTDVIGTNAIRSDGRRYFRAGIDRWQPNRADIERANPIIFSSAIVRRDLLLDARGFDEGSAVEDYELWLRLADRGARFLILDAPTVEYCEHNESKFSNASLKVQRQLLQIRLRRFHERPSDMLVLRSMLRECALTASMYATALWSLMVESSHVKRTR